MRLKIINHPAEWDRSVIRHPNAAFTHLFGWRRVIASVYRHKPVYLAAVERDTIEALVPLFRFRRPFCRPEWISIPFFDHAGILAKSQKAGQFILEKAWSMLECRNSAGLNIRQDAGFDLSGLILQGRRPQIFTEKTGLTIDLAPGPHQMLAAFPAKLRSQINKGIKNGLTWDIGGARLLPAFYKVFARNMRDLGSPVHALCFFKTIFSVFPGQALICVIYHRGMPAAAGFVFRFKNRLVNPWASSLREFRSLNTNMLLYWQMIRLACSLNLDIFDMGRSSKGAPTFRFKQQWGPELTPLSWYTWAGDRHRAPGETLSIPPWQKLPLGAANLAGPLVRKHISL
ncbi:MAG: GNAT family N-acetyltransferase [Desulfobacterales bacterium]|nr:GNAT family N-acetyltransferase [Desulfobacterales bacterium]